MKKNLNLKCLALSICCFVIGFFFRISYLHLGLNQLLFSQNKYLIRIRRCDVSIVVEITHG